VALDLRVILEWARGLQCAADVHALVEATRKAVCSVTPFQSVWLFSAEPGVPRRLRALAAVGDVTELLWEHAPVRDVEGDAMLEELCATDQPVVVEDARTDARTDKAMVARFANRTIVNVPLFVGDERVGAFGTGTFGDEGIRPPTADELELLQVFGAQLAAALERVRLLEEHRAAARERDALRQRMVAVQRIESLALLAGGVAHDFNNLLTVILSNLRFALEAPLPESRREDLEGALEATLRARDVAQQLLAVGRGRALRPEALDLNARLNLLASLLRRLLPEGVSITLDRTQAEATVLADATQIDQVFMNLCLNARDAMEGGGRLTLTTEVVELNGAFVRAHPWGRAGRFVLVTVADTGRGMPPEVLDRVFEPFFTHGPKGGTGLGLAVTHGIVQQHAGMIHCYSEVGVGTTFRVYLPLAEGARPAPAPPPEEPVPRGSERVLIAEDNPGVRDVARRILERAGYVVETAPDGLRAIEVAAHSPFDLVLLDAVMPGASGREAYERIHAARPEAAFVFASGYPADMLPLSFLQDAGIEWVEKPYDPDHLLRVMRRALNARRRA
jgi:signal transduction histidine kinase/CheY-like chemotaxis protein